GPSAVARAPAPLERRRRRVRQSKFLHASSRSPELRAHRPGPNRSASLKSFSDATKCTRPRAPCSVSVTFGSNALTPAHTAYLPRDSSASPTVIAAARLVRVHVLRAMSNTSVVSTDCPIPITLFTPLVLSVSVPPVVDMWMPFPPGHPAIVPLAVSDAARATVGAGDWARNVDASS